MTGDQLTFFMPVQIRFGAGRLVEAGEVARHFGRRCLLVTGPAAEALRPVHLLVKEILRHHQVAVIHYEGVVANPALRCIEEGWRMAMQNEADCVLGVGGGSAIDTAKAIALLYSSTGTIPWDRVLNEYTDPFRLYQAVSERPLPLIAVPTTSGTGSHVTQAAVVTDENAGRKRTIFHPANFPRVSIVDPELMCSLPPAVTAATGFDAFAHAFESYLGKLPPAMTGNMPLDAMKLIFDNLPQALIRPGDIEIRTRLALADTLAGICLANGGADIPHPLGEIIGGVCPWIPHGETLALVYPGFLRFRLPGAREKFARAAIHLQPDLESLPLDEAAGALARIVAALLKQIGLWANPSRHGITAGEWEQIKGSRFLDGLSSASRLELEEIVDDCRGRSI